MDLDLDLDFTYVVYVRSVCDSLSEWNDFGVVPSISTHQIYHAQVRDILENLPNAQRLHDVQVRRYPVVMLYY